MYFKNEKHRQAFNNNKIRFTVRKEHRRTAERTMLQIDKMLNVNRTTIWRRRMSIQRKYAFSTNSL